MKFLWLIIAVAALIALATIQGTAAACNPPGCYGGDDGCSCATTNCGMGTCSGGSCINEVCWGWYNNGFCDPAQGACDYVPATPPCDHGFYTGKQSCGTCQECNGVGTNCVFVGSGTDPYNECTYDLYCESSCSYFYGDGQCYGGSCDGGSYNVGSGYVCSGGPEYACSTIYYADSGSNSCSAPTSPEAGFGDRVVSYYACDGFGNINYGSACATSTIDCTTGCCYDAGSTTSCVASGSTATDFYSFGSGDASKADYCINAVVRDCSADAQCTAGGSYSCQYNNCLAVTGRIYVQSGAGANLAIFDQYGRIILKGSLFQSTGTSPPAGSWQITNAAGTPMGWVTSAGHLYIKGTASTGLGSVTPSGNNDFIVQNSAGTPVTYVDGATGNLYTIGTIVQNTIP